VGFGQQASYDQYSSAPNPTGEPPTLILPTTGQEIGVEDACCPALLRAQQKPQP
jgi:hypothetical protein